MEDRYIQFPEYVVIEGKVERLPHAIIDAIKGCIAIEYSEDGLYALIKNNGGFDWIEVQDTIPVDSERDYPKLTSVKPVR